MSKQYYESHITVDPVFGQELTTFKELCKKEQFRVANLVMKKGKDDQGVPSQEDSFCTGRDGSFDDLLLRMMKLVEVLGASGYKVRRYKIEHVLLDVRLV